MPAASSMISTSRGRLSLNCPNVCEAPVRVFAWSTIQSFASTRLGDYVSALVLSSSVASGSCLSLRQNPPHPSQSLKLNCNAR